MKKFEYKKENGKIWYGEKIPDIRRSAGKCPFCFRDVYVSSGQLINFFRENPVHKSCRKRFAR